MTRRWQALAALVVGVLAAACGGAQARAVNASAPAPAAGFDGMSHSQKLAFMKSTVFPKMKAEFQAFDASDYADFTCETCHGPGAATRNYTMPNADLPKLDAAHGFAKDKAAHPKAVGFMLEKVRPEMAEMLGQAESSASNPEGFGCMECHTAAQ